MASFSTACYSCVKPNGEYVAYSSQDGRLNIWETASGVLRQQYTPSSHLSATCTCLSWCPAEGENSEATPAKKKRRSGKRDSFENLDLIAVGTSAGSILLYSVSKGDLHTQLDGGHDNKVNGICWDIDNHMLYTCSDDQYIVEWNLATAKVNSKWKADNKNSVGSLCFLCRGGTTLLSAGITIKLWDLKKKVTLKTYGGHQTPVKDLMVVPANVVPKKGCSTPLESVENLYFLSSGDEKNGIGVINAWQIRSGNSSESTPTVATFSITEEIMSFKVSPTLARNKSVHLAVLTRTNKIQIFDPHLNGRSNGKTTSPRWTVEVVTQGGRGETPRPLPLVCIHFSQDGSLLVGYGTFLRIVFEKIHYNSDKKKHICLIREDPSQTLLQLDRSVDETRTPLTSEEMRVVAPASMLPSGPSIQKEGVHIDKQKKSKRKSTGTELSMEDRLDAIRIAGQSLQPVAGSGDQPPTAQSLVLLLTQGIQSQDKEILDRVLSHRGEQMIRNTVRKLPVSLVVPLVKELTQRMVRSAQSGVGLVRWAKAVLVIHTSYLMTYPDLKQTLSALYQVMDTRVTTLGKLSRLSGKLDLILSQITSKEEEELENQQLEGSALMVYQDESSDEQDVVEDIINSHSESEDEWEDLEEEKEEMDVEDEEEEADEEIGDDDSSDDDDDEDDDDDV